MGQYDHPLISDGATLRVVDRNRPRKHIERARIVLALADRHSAERMARSIGVSRPTAMVVAAVLCREGGGQSAARETRNDAEVGVK